MPSARAVVLAIAAIAALGLGVYAGTHVQGPRSGPALASGTLLREPRPIAPFALTDQDGQAYTAAQLQGHWTLLFAGFTHCPDVCPTTLALMAQLRARLPAAAPLELVFLSVDPERDTPARLKTYTSHFGGAVRGVTAASAQLDAFCASLGIAYLKVPGATATDYTMDHSAALVLLDRQGRVAGYFTPPHKLDTLAADLAGIVGT
jgi:protein SCO1/2